jgi:prephenate dehydratase
VAAERYGCVVLRAGVEDVADNETRFVWLGHRDAPPGEIPCAADPGTPASHGPWKTAIVFWGLGSEAPGWLVRCLSELASRDVNLTRIESRPRKQGLGRYMFFADFEGHNSEPHVAEALTALRGHVEVLRVLGSFAAA